MRYEPPGHAPIGSFEETILPHLGAAHNLARWLVHGSDDAEDVVQEAYLRAFRYFGTFRGGNARAWLLKVVRTTAIRSFQKNRAQQLATEFNEEIHSEGCEAVNPETLLLQRADTQLLEQAMNDLPARWREVLMLRELEGLSYKEIAEVVGVPMGTVMSTLFRARERFRDAASYPVRRQARPKRSPVPSDSERQELKQRAVPIKQPPPRNAPGLQQICLKTAGRPSDVRSAGDTPPAGLRLLQAPAAALPRALQSAPDARSQVKRPCLQARSRGRCSNPCRPASLRPGRLAARGDEHEAKPASREGCLDDDCRRRSKSFESKSAYFGADVALTRPATCANHGGVGDAGILRDARRRAGARAGIQPE